MKKYKAVIFANLNGRKVTPRKIKELKDILSLGEGKLETDIVVTENLSQLEKAVIDYKNEEINIAGIVGGDGTVMHTRTFIEDIWDQRPTYAFFPLGTMNNIQRAVGLGGKDSSVKLAKHIVETACTDSVEHYTVPFPSLDVNGYKGFNIGFGLIPKLLWMYYGHSAKQYRELEEALQRILPEDYQGEYERITGKKQIDFFDLLSKERGLWGATKAVLRLVKSVKAHTDERYLLHKPLSGEMTFDGEKQTFPQAPLGAYISCYEEVNLGLGRFNPQPSPGARKEEGKFQVVVPYGNPFAMLKQFREVINGEKLTNAVYKYISELELPAEKFAQVDGEPILADGFKVCYDGVTDIITLPVKL